jgi:hypothetical protein
MVFMTSLSERSKRFDCADFCRCGVDTDLVTCLVGVWGLKERRWAWTAEGVTLPEDEPAYWTHGAMCMYLCRACPVSCVDMDVQTLWYILSHD